MSKVINLKRGLNIRLKGDAEKIFGTSIEADKVALKPTDFPGLSPKILVKAGQEVKAGEPIFFDKNNPEILFTAPTSGEVLAINRGERRKVLEIVIKADGKNESLEFQKADPQKLSREEIKEQLKKSGTWPFLKQRPYGTVAKPETTPLRIFISGFDSSPLAPDYEFILKDQASVFQTGINALAKLTDGKIHVGIRPDQTNGFFSSIKNIEITQFTGPHPAGNVGIQIHHVAPINKGDLVWTISPQEVIYIGRLFETGKVNFSKIVALTGSEVTSPKYFKVVHGTSLDSLLKKTTKQEVKERYISGNVLTGKQVETDDFLGFYDQQVTVIPEGDYFEFLGWAMPRLNKFSLSKSYFSWLTPNKTYRADANLNGEERAYVMTGQYEKVLPMDILPVFLMKAIIAEDIDKMEQLGIYEVIEEDLALCEYVCTSKTEVQHILRGGINLMIKELGN
ncbi:MAG: Na(+)-translocating NADH-quinone reductase subunit A [Prolixibacteraceae bacterium]|nr:Na(+)-translocating NADH-quinone reductase subunit A [Prolixibacteraceae bacterium]